MTAAPATERLDASLTAAVHQHNPMSNACATLANERGDILDIKNMTVACLNPTKRYTLVLQANHLADGPVPQPPPSRKHRRTRLQARDR